MNKQKHVATSPSMRQRLLANRHGKLTPQQWLGIVTEPLLWLFFLVGLAMVVFGTRLIALMARGLWVVVLGAVLVAVIWVFASRAMRYARAPIAFARLYAGIDPYPKWVFWRPVTFYDANNMPLQFRWLSEYPPLRIDGEYYAYYLEETGGNILLSIVDTDDEDVEEYLPTRAFQTAARKRRR